MKVLKIIGNTCGILFGLSLISGSQPTRSVILIAGLIIIIDNIKDLIRGE